MQQNYWYFEVCQTLSTATSTGWRTIRYSGLISPLPPSAEITPLPIPNTIHNNYSCKVGWNDVLSFIQFPGLHSCVGTNHLLHLGVEGVQEERNPGLLDNIHLCLGQVTKHSDKQTDVIYRKAILPALLECGLASSVVELRSVSLATIKKASRSAGLLLALPTSMSSSPPCWRAAS